MYIFRKVFGNIKDTMELPKEHEPHLARSETTKHGINTLMKVYKNVFNVNYSTYTANY